MVAIWIAVSLQTGVRAAYYEWGLTCSIVAYTENHGGVPPRDWNDLVGYEYHSNYLPEPRDFDVAAQYVEVDFGSLHAFANHEIAELPLDVLQPIRGIRVGWISPKYELERYFRDSIVPAGTLNNEKAAFYRAAAEKQRAEK